VRLLLDTHALIWFLGNDKRIPAKPRRAIEDAGNEAFASAASGYEIAHKCFYGKLDPTIVRELETMTRRSRIEVLPVTLGHAIEAGELAGMHKDPWDRVLMAQARLENLVVVTRDGVFEEYGLRTLR
jgi:PIN domain nuclease of toxin-antitoxin system